MRDLFFGPYLHVAYKEVHSIYNFSKKAKICVMIVMILFSGNYWNSKQLLIIIIIIPSIGEMCSQRGH